MPFHCCHVFNIKSFLFCLASLFTLAHFNLHAQIPGTELFQQKINQYNAGHPKQVLFVQTEKTIYTNKETIWFAAYLLHDVKDSLLKPDILSVAVVEESTRKIAIQKKYLFQNDLCPGSLLLPDSIRPGNYELLAFTNLVDKKGVPLSVFHQRLTIKFVKDVGFSTNFTIDTSSASDSLRIDIKVILPGVGTGLASFASIDYYLPDEQSKTFKLDIYGRGTILIPSVKIKQPGQELFATIRYKDQTQYFNVQLPQPARTDSVNVLFYPEGGDLVDRLPGRIAWEAKTSFGAAVQTTALLIKDGKIIDTLKNNNDGVGILSLIPENSSRYVLRLLIDNKKLAVRDFPLPSCLQKGIVLEIKDAVAADTLSVNIRSNVNQRISIAISNNDEGTVSIPVNINKEKNIRLPLDKISKGINTITILDEAGRPRAERLFFAHFDKRNSAALLTDKTIYKTREQVNLGFQLANADSTGISGLLTVACTQNNRIEPVKQKDIETYYYLEQLFEGPPFYTSGSAYENKVLIEDVLLLKGWRRYTWQRIMQADDPDTAGSINKLVLKGQVFRNNKILKKPADLVMMRDTIVGMFTTDASGAFTMNAGDISVTENRKMFMRVSGENTSAYRIISADTLETTMLYQASHLSFHPSVKLLELQTSLQQIPADQPKVKVLKEVIVTARTDNFLSGKTNACGDYVCSRGYLNCPYRDEPFSIPVKGKFYRVNSIIWRAYAGCVMESEPSLAEVSNVYTAREFYGMDSTLLQQTTPEYMSTIYWKPFVLTDEKGQAKFSFYTSDIKGDFRITVQGVGSNGEPFYNEKRIRVE